MGYQEVETPQGSFIGWGSKPGQVIEGRVTDYDPAGATDFGGSECPALEIELTRTGHSYVKEEWHTYEAGDLVQISCGQVQLKKKVRKAQPRIGDMIRIELVDLVKVSNGTVKSFTVGIDKNAASSNGGGRNDPAEEAFNASQDGTYSSSGLTDDEPPF